MWGVWWNGNQVRVLCDNMAVVQILASNCSSDKLIMHLLQGLHFCLAYYNINLRASHTPGSTNMSADAISRNLMQVFFRENPTARRHPTPIPDSLWVRTQPDWRSETWRKSLTASLRVASQIALDDRIPPDRRPTPRSAPDTASTHSQPWSNN